MKSFSLRNMFTTGVVVLFSISLAFGKYNPFGVTSSADEDAGIGFGQLMTVLLIPLLYINKNKCKKLRLPFYDWKQPLVTFYFISLVIVVMLASSLTLGLIVSWIKLFMGVLVCVLLPYTFNDKRILHYSLFSFSIACGIICVLAVSGLLGSLVEVRNGRLLLWGENPNSTSTRWVLAVLYITNFVVFNPLNKGKYRYILLVLLLPLMMMIMMSGSRGSFIIALFCVFINIYFLGKNSPKLFFLMGILLGGLTMYLIGNFDNSSYSLFDRFNTYADSSEDIRTQLMEASFTIFLSNPILGVGQYDYLLEMNKLGYHLYVHNLYMHVLTICGVVGFIPFAIFIIKLLCGTYKVIKENSIPFIILCYMLLIAYKTGGILTYLFMWFVFGVVASMVNNTMRERR